MSKRKDNTVLVKSMDFAVRIVKLYQYLTSAKNEYVLSKQLLRSGTSIGANLNEATEAFWDKDFQFKISIALKEARESEYWLMLLNKTEHISNNEFNSIYNDCSELLKLLTSITKALKDKDKF